MSTTGYPVERNSLMNVVEPGSYDRLRGYDPEPIDLELGADGVWAVPEAQDTTRLYREGVFIGRITGQAVYDCTGRLRCGDEFEQFVLEGKCD